MIVLGIDVGKITGLAWVKSDDESLIKYAQGYYWELKLNHPFDVAYIELVHAFPKQGVVSMFELGKAYGYWLGYLNSHKMNYKIITPNRWKALTSTLRFTKEKAREFVNQKYGLSLKPKEQHVADAILIAIGGVRNEA